MQGVDAILTQGLKPDIVFSDIQMPELDGLALAVRLKQVSHLSKSNRKSEKQRENVWYDTTRRR